MANASFKIGNTVGLALRKGVTTFDKKILGPPGGLSSAIATIPVAGQSFGTIMGLFQKCIGVQWGAAGVYAFAAACGADATNSTPLSIVGVSKNGDDWNVTNFNGVGLHTVLPFKLTGGPKDAQTSENIILVGGYKITGAFLQTNVLLMGSADYGKTWQDVHIPRMDIGAASPFGFQGGASILAIGYAKDQQTVWVTGCSFPQPADTTITAGINVNAYTATPSPTTSVGGTPQLPGFVWGQTESHVGDNFALFIEANNGFPSIGYPAGIQLVDNAIAGIASGGVSTPTARTYPADYRSSTVQGQVVQSNTFTHNFEGVASTINNKGEVGSIDASGAITFRGKSYQVPGDIADFFPFYMTDSAGGGGGFATATPYLASFAFNPAIKA